MNRLYSVKAQKTVDYPKDWDLFHGLDSQTFFSIDSIAGVQAARFRTLYAPSVGFSWPLSEPAEIKQTDEGVAIFG
jgi:hypothetical protein